MLSRDRLLFEVRTTSEATACFNCFKHSPGMALPQGARGQSGNPFAQESLLKNLFVKNLQQGFGKKSFCDSTAVQLLQKT